MYTDLVLMKDMTREQRMILQAEYARVAKDRTTAVLLTLFLGGVGAHRFYLGQVGLGIVYLLFCWTFVPSIIALMEVFVVSGRVDAYNAREARELAAKVRILRMAA
jgi:TM2 domain-containing membrane protein YozV